MAIRNREAMGKREIDLRGPEGNVFYLLGTAKSLAKDLNRELGEAYDFEKIKAEMTSGDYEHAIQVFDSYFGEYVDLFR